MQHIEIVVAHSQRTTLRVGDVFLKVDVDPVHAETEIRAMAIAPVPTPEVRWYKPPVLAISAVSGAALGVLGEPSPASRGAWAAAGAAIRQLHDAPIPPWSGRSVDDITAELDRECAWLLDHAGASGRCDPPQP